MGCWAIVPIKAAAACKTRLAHVLGPDRREGLARRMLVQVVEAALAAPAIERVLVVSPEQHALPPGVVQLQDIGCGLNEALELARGYARAAGATQLAVLAADLPWLTAADIGTLVGAAAAGEMALACDRHGPGTNAVCLDALLPFVFAFGAGSAARPAAAPPPSPPPAPPASAPPARARAGGSALVRRRALREAGAGIRVMAR